jgi:diguanylate cyclase
MNYWELPEQAAAFSQKAFDMLSHFRIAATPQNYELFFLYSVNQNPELTKSLGDLMHDHPELPPAELTRLYDKFCRKNNASETVADVGTKMQEELQKLASLLEHTGSDTAAYGKTLNAFAVQLDKGEVSAQLKTLLAGVAAATRAIETRNRNLEAQLAQSGEEIKTLRGRIEAIRLESLTDPLTNLANRRAFDEKMEESIAEALAEGHEMSVLIGDVDHFKKFNDTWGHATGDQVLRLVAQCFKANTKGRDTPARFGGEEFVVVMPQTALNNAVTVANQIRSAVESKKIVKRSTGETLGTITVSIGAARYRPGESISDLLNRADQCLYGAKRTGRNRVVHEDELEQIEHFGDVVKQAG